MANVTGVRVSFGKRGLKRFFDVLIAGVVVVSIVWTCVSAFVFVRGFLRVRSTENSSIEARVAEGMRLPRLDGDLRLRALLADVVSIGRGDSLVGEARYSPAGALVGVSICVLVPDSLFFYRFAYLSDCGCPLSKKDRYDLWLRYVDPQSGVVLRDEVRKGLSAEEVGRLVEFVEVERR